MIDCEFCGESYNESCVLKCGHSFHCVCIHKWMLYNATCPLCRVVVDCCGEHSDLVTKQLIRMYIEVSRKSILKVGMLEIQNEVFELQYEYDQHQIQAQQILLMLSSPEINYYEDIDR